MFIDMVSLGLTATSIFLSTNSQGFLTAIALGLLLAALAWYGCAKYAQLWNRRFQVKPVHHLICALAAIVTLFASLIYPAFGYLHEAGEVSIAVWKARVQSDPVWASETFHETYLAVQKLGLEDFSDVPQPGAPGSFIPVNHQESRYLAAATYASAACRDLAAQRPFLSLLVWARPSIPTETLAKDAQVWFQTNKSYPPQRAIALVTQEINGGLTEQLPQTVTIGRISLVLLFLLVQSLTFGSIGYASYRALRVAPDPFDRR